MEISSKEEITEVCKVGDDIPRTATMKVRRLYIEELLKNEE
ncbi:hypothetical protein [Enterococcus cecorum]|nr:hypothetical protein [Enterococcus cecorum]